MSQYNIASHTILPLIFKIAGPKNHITYLLKQPISKSLFMFNPLANIRNEKSITGETQQKYHSWLCDHIRNIEKLSQSRLTHIICNHSLLDNECGQLIQNFKKISERGDIKYLKPDPSNKFNIKPQVIGQISICFIDAEGYAKDYNLIGVTHISPTSTKVPVLFVNNLIGVCRIDHEHTILHPSNKQFDEDYLKSLNKVKYFPNQTYIFPSHCAQLTDLLFAKALIGADSNNYKASQLLEQKIKYFQQNKSNQQNCLIPTTVMEEKLMNPFLNPQKFHKILSTSSKDKAFGVLRKMRLEWNKNQ